MERVFDRIASVAKTKPDASIRSRHCRRVSFRCVRPVLGVSGLPLEHARAISIFDGKKKKGQSRGDDLLKFGPQLCGTRRRLIHATLEIYQKGKNMSIPKLIFFLPT